MKLHVLEKFVFTREKCYGPHNLLRLKNSMSFNFCASMSIFLHVCDDLKGLTKGAVGQKRVFVRFGLSENFAGSFMSYHNFRAIRPFLAHSDKS